MKGLIKKFVWLFGSDRLRRAVSEQPAACVTRRRPVSGVVRAALAAGARSDMGTLGKYKQIQQERDQVLRNLDWTIATMSKPLDDWEPAAIAYHCSRGQRHIAPAEDVPMDDWSEEMITRAATKARLPRHR